MPQAQGWAMFNILSVRKLLKQLIWTRLIPDGPEVEGYVRFVLNDQYNQLADCMSHANFVEHIRISAGAVGDY